MEEEALVEAVKARRNIWRPTTTKISVKTRGKLCQKKSVSQYTYDWYSILYSNYLNSHVVYTCLCRCTTSVNILVINESLERSLFSLA